MVGVRWSWAVPTEREEAPAREGWAMAAVSKPTAGVAADAAGSSGGLVRAGLIGRAEELAAVRKSLSAGGCVIFGLAGVGKTRLAAEAAGDDAVHVIGTSAAAAIPFGAFAHLGASLPMEGESPIAVYLRAFRESAGARTLVVDDAHLLDAGSAALVLALRMTGTARVIATVRQPEPVPDPIVALWKDGHAGRLDLEPLSPPETRTLVEDLVGSKVHAEVPRRVFQLTEGNPLYVRELLADARRSGALREVDGRWTWTGGRPTDTRLRDLVGARLTDVSAPARDCAELLALGAPLPLDRLTGLSSLAAVEELERAGIAVFTGGDVPAVDLAHPLYAEVVAAEMGVAAATRHRRALAAAAAEASATDPTELLRVASWRLEVGDFDDGLFLAAAAVALRRGDGDLALRLAEHAGDGLDAALLRASAHLERGQFAELDAVLAAHEAEAAAADRELAKIYVRLRTVGINWGTPDHGAALQILEQASSWHDTPDWEGFLTAFRGGILLARALPGQAFAVIEPLLDRTDLIPRTKLEALLVFGFACCRLGQVGRCEALEPEILRLVAETDSSPWDTGWAQWMVDGGARIDAGRDLDGVEARLDAARREAEANNEDAFTAALLIMQGRLALVRGHFDQAASVLTEAVDLLSAGDPRNARSLALAYLARAQAQAGRIEAAATTFDQTQRAVAERPANPWVSAELVLARAWHDAASGQVATAREQLLAAADAAGEDLFAAAQMTYDALRLGADPRVCADRLTRVVRPTDNDLLQLCADHAEAMAAGDAKAQLEVARTFGKRGIDLFAAEAAARAAAALQQAGLARSADAAAAFAARHRDRCGPVSTPALDALIGVDELTPREREVAVLAAQGLSNADVATQLILSVRTVETHLQRAYRKLGIGSRDELVDLLAPEADRP